VRKLCICGNVLSTDKKVRYKENVQNKIELLQAALKFWKGRNLTINGRMLFIKTFALSQITFTCQFSSFMPNDVKEIDSICYRFLQGDKTERVKRAYLKNDKDKGGINGVDIECFLAAIKL